MALNAHDKARLAHRVFVMKEWKVTPETLDRVAEDATHPQNRRARMFREELTDENKDYVDKLWKKDTQAVQKEWTSQVKKGERA